MRIGTAIAIHGSGDPNWIEGFPSQLFFARHQFLGNGTVVSTLDPFQSRATARYAQTASGTWKHFAAGESAVLSGIGYNSREGWTNAIPAPFASGGTNGVIGSGGVLPTGWSQASVSGITKKRSQTRSHLSHATHQMLR